VGKHRVPIPDLISAATAQISDLVVLHYDADFELISKVTGQAHEWVAERGTLVARVCCSISGSTFGYSQRHHVHRTGRLGAA